MRREEARKVAAHLAKAFGLDQDRMDTLAEALTDPGLCSACVAEAVDIMVANADTLPRNPVPAVIGAIRRQADSAHSKHLIEGLADDSGRIAKAEKFWRHDAVEVIDTFVHDRLMAQFIAGHMWSLGTVPEDTFSVTDDMRRFSVWKAVGENRRDAGLLTPAFIERVYTFGREAAHIPPAMWTEEKFEAMTY